ncbi:MAG TPA: hypothetical protein VHC69_23110 [Polyangiaceae bacterium]|nr:hypothetical protein [Polyangiaceae bacterium]
MILRSFAVLLAALAVVLSSCSEAPSDARIGILAPNGSEAAFGAVADMLEHRCGSLDCHGQPARNLRVYGCEGMRLSIDDVSICNPRLGGQKTTPDEHQATYRSLVGLEPTVMSEVVANHGADPELLTFVRKARGTEAHKGGQLFTPGDDQDTCVTTWLAGHTNNTACGNAIGIPNFPTLPSQ